MIIDGSGDAVYHAPHAWQSEAGAHGDGAFYSAAVYDAFCRDNDDGGGERFSAAPCGVPGDSIRPAVAVAAVYRHKPAAAVAVLHKPVPRELGPGQGAAKPG